MTAQGTTPLGKHISRSGAKSGDWVYLTGEVGDAGLALQHLKGKLKVEDVFVEQIMSKLNYPKPRVLAGQALREYASAAIDISDGVIADLTHICKASNVGANIVLDSLPLSKVMLSTLEQTDAAKLALSSGDDYELLFTVSEDNKVGMETALNNLGVPIRCIGQINPNEAITTTMDSKPIALEINGYEHFLMLNHKGEL